MNSGTQRMRGRFVTAILATLGLSVALAGCGQKGNLYLPNQKKKVPVAQPQPEPAPAPAPASAPSGAQ
jgi:predicted small lipoprotein YifL